MAGPARDLTQGPIGRTLLLFAAPTLVANILQSLNVSINTIWIGRFLGEKALAATANASNIIFLGFSTMFGFGMAAMIFAGQHMGRKDIQGARKVVGAAATLLAGISLLVAAIGIGLTDRGLEWLGTPAESAPLASAYLKTMLLGFPCSAIIVLLMMSLRTIGDAVTPLWFMIVGIVLDAGLNPLFIAGFGPFPALGIVGSAVATLIANAIGVVGMLAVIYRRDLPIRLRGAEFRYLLPSPALLRMIFAKGMVMGLQMLVATASALAMIGLINRAGVITVAAYGVAVQLWNYVQMPAIAVGAAVSAMAAQNIGAGRWDRVESITRSGLLFHLLITGTLLALLTIFDRPMLGLFLGRDSPSIPIAEHIQLIAGWSFILSGVTMIFFGTARANGAVVVPLIIFFIGLFLCRLSFAVLMQPLMGFDALWWAFPFGSVVNAILAWAYYAHGGWKKTLLVDRAETAERPPA
jgi:putative MATE family efflux protein